jgi:Mn-dependent DtxR family transcriptional regulator
MTMTESQWYHELEVAFAGRGEDDFMTTEELADMLGVSNRTVRERLRPFKREGRLVSKKRRFVGIHDNPVWVPSYKILPKEGTQDAQEEPAGG